MDKELQQVVRDAELGKRIADKLVSVRLFNGEETWVLIHLEIQGKVDATFAERMFVHYYRLHDRHERKIASIALLTDEHPAWQPRQYKQTTLCCTIQLDFSVAKMLDFAQNWQRLEETATLLQQLLWRI